jgi:hypothetical protein
MTNFSLDLEEPIFKSDEEIDLEMDSDVEAIDQPTRVEDEEVWREIELILTGSVNLNEEIDVEMLLVTIDSKHPDISLEMSPPEILEALKVRFPLFYSNTFRKQPLIENQVQQGLWNMTLNHTS